MFISVLLSLIFPIVMLVVVVLFVCAFLVMAPRVVRRIKQRRHRRMAVDEGQVSGARYP